MVSEISRQSVDHGIVVACTVFCRENRLYCITRGVAWVKCRTVAFPSSRLPKPRDVRPRCKCIESVYRLCQLIARYYMSWQKR